MDYGSNLYLKLDVNVKVHLTRHQKGKTLFYVNYTLIKITLKNLKSLVNKYLTD